MLPFIVLYVAGFLVTLEVTLIWFFVDEHPAPVLTSLTMAVTWPLFAVHYAWLGVKMFVLHMVREFTGG